MSLRVENYKKKWLIGISEQPLNMAQWKVKRSLVRFVFTILMPSFPWTIGSIPCVRRSSSNGVRLCCEKYRVIQDRLFQSDFDRLLLSDLPFEEMDKTFSPDTETENTTEK